MAAGDYRSEYARLCERLAELRRDGAPADWLSNTLTNLLQLHLGHSHVADAQLALEEIASLRRPEIPTVEAEYYLGAARLASHTGAPARAVWFAERAIAVCRRQQVEDLHPVVLMTLSDALKALGRNDEACWAQIEATERFEDTGQFACASAVLLLHCDDLGPGDEPAALHRAVALALRAEGPAAKVRALNALGRWHLLRDEYLPSRRAFDRALGFARQGDDAAEVSNCLSDLSALETFAFHHEDALRLAAEAERAAPTAFWKAYALEAQETVLARLHHHDVARATLLEAAGCFEEAGEPESAKSARHRARQHAIHAFLHRLPTWVYRRADLSTRETAARKGFQPLGAWVLGLSLAGALLWTDRFLTLAAGDDDNRREAVRVIVAFYPWAVMLAVLLLIRYRTRRAGLA